LIYVSFRPEKRTQIHSYVSRFIYTDCYSIICFLLLKSTYTLLAPSKSQATASTFSWIFLLMLVCVRVLEYDSLFLSLLWSHYLPYIYTHRNKNKTNKNPIGVCVIKGKRTKILEKKESIGLLYFFPMVYKKSPIEGYVYL